MQLTQGAETLWHLGLVHVGLHGSCGHLQSHHLSGVFDRTCFVFATALQAQVSIPRLPRIYIANLVDLSL